MWGIQYTIGHIALQLHDILFREKNIMVSGPHIVSLTRFAPREHSITTVSIFESVLLCDVSGYHPARYADVPAECIATNPTMTDPGLVEDL